MRYSKGTLAIRQFLSMIQFIAGIFFTFIFGVTFLVMLPEDDIASDIILGILTVLSAFIIYRSRRTKRIINNFKTYVGVISNESTGSISKIASTTGIPQEVVKKELEYMVSKNYFADAYVDGSKNELVFLNQKVLEPEPTVNTQASAQQEVKEKGISVVCNCCGGVNHNVVDTSGGCAYCGVSLKHK